MECVRKNTIIYCCSLPHYSTKRQIHLRCMDHHTARWGRQTGGYMWTVDIYKKKQSEGWKLRWRGFFEWKKRRFPVPLTFIWSLTDFVQLHHEMLLYRLTESLSCAVGSHNYALTSGSLFGAPEIGSITSQCFLRDAQTWIYNGQKVRILSWFAQLISK